MEQPHDPSGPRSDPISLHELLARMPFGIGALSEKLGIRFVDGTRERLTATMPIRGNEQPYGLLHGGASVALAETLGSVGSAMHGYPDRLALGVDINATHHRPATAGMVTGIATAVHLGRASACYEVEISDERGHRVCTSRITCALVPVEHKLTR
jgi:1,4-dihydroxy-2-naphthoyl-CoA hydrolase